MASNFLSAVMYTRELAGLIGRIGIRSLITSATPTISGTAQLRHIGTTGKSRGCDNAYPARSNDGAFVTAKSECERLLQRQLQISQKPRREIFAQRGLRKQKSKN
ncbi:hypothetical protein [Bradyrhizobium sp.]|uniref:hypothetical protein n=1 Tax=Bradyrhizobium sp. TaxID=376 RepID=UPI0026284130|nr:hypothetical protein [Bradyrhizobium sp.]